MTSHEAPTLDDDIISADDFQAFADRIREVYRPIESIGNHITDLYDQGKHEEAKELIDTHAEELAMQDERSQGNLRQLQKLRSYRDKDTVAIKTLVDSQKQIVEEYRVFIINELGLPDEARLSQIEQARNAIAERLSTSLPEGYNPGEALEELGIITVHDNEVEYHFPSELVPKSTTELWETYLASVCHHVQTQRNLSRGLIDDKGAVEQADKTRTYAHNAVTKELHSILNFNENQWKNRDTRELLGKIRDFTFPTYESAVSGDSESFVKEQQGHLQVASKLASSSH